MHRIPTLVAFGTRLGAAALAFFAIVTSSLPGRAAEIHVPLDVWTIQEAVDLAAPGDTVTIHPRAYEESFSLVPDVTVRGATGSPEDVRLTGTIWIAPSSGGVRRLTGISLESGSLKIQSVSGGADFDLQVRDCRFGDGTEVRVNFSPSYARQFVASFVNCDFGPEAGAVFLGEFDLRFESCRFAAGGAVWLDRTYRVELVGCDVGPEVEIRGFRSSGPNFLSASACRFAPESILFADRTQGSRVESCDFEKGSVLAYSSSTDLEIADCRFDGAWVSSLTGDAITVSRCRFEVGREPPDRRALLVRASNVRIEDSTFRGYAVTGLGGAILYDANRSSHRLDVVNCTIVDCWASAGGAAVANEGEGALVVRNSIFAFCDMGSTVACPDGAGPTTVEHCLIYGNVPDDETCAMEDGVLRLDPEFCWLDGGDVTVGSGSPALAASPQNPWGEDLGAHGVGCEDPTAIEAMSWGLIKAAYR